MNTQHRIWSALLLLVVGLIPATAWAAPPAPPARLPHRLVIYDLDPTEVARDLGPSPQSGPGAVIHVTTFDPNIAADGQCSLIEAIVNANNDAATHVDCTAGSGPDTIELPTGTYTLTLINDPINGGNGLPLVTSTIIINGHGATVSRSAAPLTPQFRIVYVATSGNLTLNDLTISNGAVASGISGGGIRNHGTLTLTNCTLENNTAFAGGGILNGDGFVPIISQAPGFVAYYALDAGNDVVASVSAFHDQAGADEFNRLASSWVRQEIASLMAGPPEITAGAVKVHQTAWGL